MSLFFKRSIIPKDNIAMPLTFLPVYFKVILLVKKNYTYTIFPLSSKTFCLNTGYIKWIEIGLGSQFNNLNLSSLFKKNCNKRTVISEKGF